MNNLNCMNNQTYTASGLVPPLQYKILALFGKSGAGKDTIKKWIINNTTNTKELIPYTTRPKRDYEIEGKDYHFIDDIDLGLMKQQGWILESTKFKDWSYALPFKELKKDKINVGVFNLKEINFLLADSRFEVLPVLIDTPDRTRLKRLLNREKYPDCKEVCRRFLADEEDFNNIPFNYITFCNDGTDEYFNILNIPKIKEFMRTRSLEGLK